MMARIKTCEGPVLQLFRVADFDSATRDGPDAATTGSRTTNSLPWPITLEARTVPPRNGRPYYDDEDDYYADDDDDGPAVAYVPAGPPPVYYRYGPYPRAYYGWSPGPYYYRRW